MRSFFNRQQFLICKLTHLLLSYVYSHPLYSLSLCIFSLFLVLFWLFLGISTAEIDATTEILRGLCVSGSLCLWPPWVSGSLGHWASVSLSLRASGPLGFWVTASRSGPLGVWAFGPLGLWAFGPLGLWVSGPLGLSAPGSLGPWVSGPLGLWTSGPLGLWLSGSPGLWVCKSLGLRVLWVTLCTIPFSTWCVCQALLSIKTSKQGYFKFNSPMHFSAPISHDHLGQIF